MSFFDFFKGKKTTERRGLTVFDNYTCDGALKYGSLYNNSGAMNVSAAYRCIDLISDAVATLPVYIKKKDSKGQTNIVKNHPCNLLFDDKNNLLTKYNFFKMIVQSVILKGNGFAYIYRAADGTPTALRWLNSGDVVVTYIKEKNELYYQAPIIRGGRINRADMLHFVKNSYDGINGVSLVTYAKRSLDITHATDNTAKSFFENGANLNGVISVNGPSSIDQRRDAKKEWDATFANGGRGVAVLPMNMTYQQVTMNADDAQMLESRKFNIEDIARFFGVNPLLLGIQGTSAYKSLEEINQDFLVHTLMGYVTMIENELSMKLLRTDEKNLKIILDTNGMLRANKQAQAEYYVKMVTNGIMTRNEVRKDLGLNSVEGGDELMIPYTDTEQNKINQDSDGKTENNEEEKLK